MRETIAQLVHPILAHGLNLQARLARGEMPDIDQEQAVLKDLLLSDFESLRWRDFGGDRASAIAGGNGAALDAWEHAADHFLGIRYLLACWLDEMLCNESPWGTRWNEQKLEVEIYGTNDRAWRFWDQANVARTRPGGDAFEAAYLCVVLGFRGQLRKEHQRLRTWIESAKRRLGKVEQPTWKHATDFMPPKEAAPLTGRNKLRRMALTAWVALLVLIPLTTFFLIHKLGS